MSYTYNPGTRQDALSILRDKGLLDTPARMEPQPGTFVLDASGHFRIGEDGKSVPVRPKYPARPANDCLPVHAFLNFRSLGWALVSLMILAGLLGLLTVGAK